MRFSIDSLRLLNITNNQLDGYFRTPVRRYPRYTVFCVVKGRMCVTAAGAENSLSANEIFVVRPKTPFRVSSLPPEGPVEWYALKFLYSPAGPELPAGHYDLSGMPHLRLGFQQIMQEQRNKGLYYIEKKKALLTGLLIDLKRLRDRKARPSRGVSLPVARIINYIHAHRHERIRVRDLFSGTPYSPVHLSRRFKAETGLSPKQYLLHMRNRKARELLLESQLNISQIADMCGYADVFDFSRRFKKETGYSPSEFRKGMKT
jgi:AraC-like DNA-binding protein